MSLACYNLNAKVYACKSSALTNTDAIVDKIEAVTRCHGIDLASLDRPADVTCASAFASAVSAFGFG